MSKVIAIANFKGGVGKTTSTVNIGAGLALKGYRVLLIDLDPQFNLTQSLGVEEAEAPVYGALKGSYPLQPVSVIEGLELIPSSIDLIRGEVELNYEFKREEILSKLLQPIRDSYDYILIDCPPSLGILTINAFVASDLIFVPIEAEYLSLKGYAVLNEAIGAVGLGVDRVFVTQYDSRIVLNRSVLEGIQENLKDKAFKTVIRQNIALAEAPIRGLDIFRYQPTSYGAEDYSSLVEEVIAVTQ